MVRVRCGHRAHAWPSHHLGASESIVNLLLWILVSAAFLIFAACMLSMLMAGSDGDKYERFP